MNTKGPGFAHIQTQGYPFLPSYKTVYIILRDWLTIRAQVYEG